MTTQQFILPTYWAQPLINNDWEYLTSGEKADIEGWLKQSGVKCCLDADLENTDFKQFMGQGNEVCIFTFEA